MPAFRKCIVLMLAVLGLAAGAYAGDAAAPAKPTKQTPPVVGNADLQKLIDQFSARRDTILAEREALLNQLKTATAEQKKAILDKMQAQQKDLIDAQRALGRQIRDEMRQLKQTLPSGPGHR